MSTVQDLRDLLARTTPIHELMEAARQHPVELFLRIAGEYERTGQPVADHQLGLIHYVSDVALRALAEAGLIQQQAQGRHFIRAFVPTPKGQEYFHRIQSEGAAGRDGR